MREPPPAACQPEIDQQPTKYPKIQNTIKAEAGKTGEKRLRKTCPAVRCWMNSGDASNAFAFPCRRRRSADDNDDGGASGASDATSVWC